jgi:hypothetical protein
MAPEQCYAVSPAKVFARPTADQVWLGSAQQAALSRLLGPENARLLVGPPSSGKSTLLAYATAQLAADSVVLFCRGPQLGAEALLAALLLSAGLGCWELSGVEQRNLLTVFIQQRRSQRRRVILAIDDAHMLAPEAWEEIERLRVWRIDHKPAVQLLLAGARSLLERLAPAPSSARLDQPAIHALEPVAQQDLASYIDWRLGRFDIGGVITPVATQLIARLSGGRFESTDVLCQMSLLLLRRHQLELIDARVVRQAVAALAARKEVKLEAATAPPTEWRSRSARIPRGHLLISRGGKVLKRATLAERVLLGRSQHNDICLPSPYLGRHHAVIVGTPEGYYVVDLNSVNGLELNGQRVTRAILCDQDVLGIGPFRVKVQLPEWIAHGSPLPARDSLTDTAVMPAQKSQTPTIVRVK